MRRGQKNFKTNIRAHSFLRNWARVAFFFISTNLVLFCYFYWPNSLSSYTNKAILLLHTVFFKYVLTLHYCQMGWIGTVEVNRDTGLEPGETFCLSLLKTRVLLHLHCPDPPRLIVTITQSYCIINTFWLCTNGHVRTSRVTNALVPLLKNRDINFCHMHATILLKVFLSVRPSFLPLVHHAVEISANYPWPPTRDWCCQAYGLVLINSF